MATERASAFTCIVYPDGDNTPSDWVNKIEELQIQAVISPLHYLDVLEDGSGEFKKPHYHVAVRYSSLKSFKQVQSDFDTFGGVYPHDYNLFRLKCVVRNWSVCLRYFCHLDNETKHKYNTIDVSTFGGVDYFSDIAKDDNNIFNVTSAIIDYCINQGITNFYRLCVTARSEHPEWIPIIVRNAFFFKTYLQSSNLVSSPLEGFSPASAEVTF